GLTAQGPQGTFLPWIHCRAPWPPPKKIQGELPEEAAPFCKLEQLRACLASHPDLEEALSAELFLKVLEVLDPERKLEDTWAYCQDTRRRTGEPARLLKKRPTQICLGLPGKIPVSHSGQWRYEGKPRKMDLPQEDGSTLHEDGDLNIDEEFIRKQFDTDHQSKPSSDVPHATRLSQVPLELEKRVGLNKLQRAGSFQKPNQERQSQRPQDPYNPRRVKTNYGVWHLRTGLWKKQRAEERLVDLSVSHKVQDENFEKELWKWDAFLADLHGTVAFKDFVLSRSYRMPRFLEKVYVGKEGKCAYRKTPLKRTQA
ncbi:Protein FAM47E, partial [Heterocephalus glaber]